MSKNLYKSIKKRLPPDFESYLNFDLRLRFEDFIDDIIKEGSGEVDSTLHYINTLLPIFLADYRSRAIKRFKKECGRNKKGIKFIDDLDIKEVDKILLKHGMDGLKSRFHRINIEQFLKEFSPPAR